MSSTGRLAPLFVLCVLSLVSAPAVADLADYDPGSTDWTGLQDMVDAARGHGIELEPVDAIDYGELEPEQPLVIIYPQHPLDVESLSRYVVDGGRIFVADDFGASERLLDRLEISRVIPAPDNLPHDEYVAHNPAFPVFAPPGRHPLLDGVERVVANHPAVITNIGGPVIGYDAGGGLVYDMNLGDGKVVVVADSSMFINQMLPVAHNERLLLNALRYVCRDEAQCRPLLLTRDFEQRGSYAGDSPFDTGGDFAEDIEAINEAIADFVDELPGEDLLFYLSLLLVAGLAVYLATVFPFRRTRAYSAYVSDFFDTIPPPQSEFDWNVSRFGRGSRTMNYALPLSILKEVFEELFLTEFGHWPSRSEQRPAVENLAEEFARHYGGKTEASKERAYQEVAELLAVFARIPPRHRVFLDSDAHFTEADLLRYYRRAMKILERMGLHDEYERRTRGAR